jgi:hypothetical protein
LINEYDSTNSKAVYDLFKYLRDNHDAKYKGIIDSDASKSAYGLAFIYRLLVEYMKMNTATDTYASIGLTEAIGILDYLIMGTDHPIAKHIAGIRSPDFRKHVELEELSKTLMRLEAEQSGELKLKAMNKAQIKEIKGKIATVKKQKRFGPPKKTNFEELRRVSVVGAVLAIMEAAKINREQAIKKLIAALAGRDYGLTKDKIIAWQNKFNDELHKHHKGPIGIRDLILNISNKTGEPVINAAIYVIGKSHDAVTPA